MPAFNTIPAPALYSSDSVVLVNAADATAGNITFTQQVVGVQSAQVAGNQWKLTNTTNQTATVYSASADSPAATANYEPLTNADFAEAVTCPAAETIIFTAFGFICCHFASSPTSGTLTIAR